MKGECEMTVTPDVPHKNIADSNETKNQNERLLDISPSTLQFHTSQQNCAAMEALIKLQNKMDNAVAFKIKTSNPGAFKVQPACGVLWPKRCLTVLVQTIPGMVVQPNDKILIQMVAANKHNKNVHEIKKLWRNISSERIVNQKLTCSFPFHSVLLSSESLDIQQQSSIMFPSSPAVKMTSHKETRETNITSEDKEFIKKIEAVRDRLESHSNVSILILALALFLLMLTVYIMWQVRNFSVLLYSNKNCQDSCFFS
ncbi:uncharacterized protein LOC143230645 isoform X3 [Tachypleus tridentatus]|uniref:uncharacterized protein LOC143230645 isoform X3 n=1 Tax=Tachypleus tridentatus TaxID=6853 RepID=UPI003FD2D69D